MLRNCKWSVIALGVTIACGCATPGNLSTTKGAALSQVRKGMSPAEVRRMANTSGEPVANFQDGGKRYLICKFMPRESGTFYYALWIDGKLEGMLPEDKERRLESLQPVQSAPSALPHSEGFDVLLRPFASAPAPQDLNIPTSPTTDRQKEKERNRAEMVMWAPVAVALLPVMPLQLVVVGKSMAGYQRYYSVNLGLSADAAQRKLGKANKVLGDPASYGIWVYDYCPVEGKELITTLGFRNGAVTWIRYNFDPTIGIPAK